MSNNSRQTQFSFRQNHGGSSQNPGLSHAQDQSQQHQHRRTYDRHRSQSFTSLMTDLCQDINRVNLYLAGALMEHLLEGIAPLRHWNINPNEKI